jgi:hypothetical protein
MPGDVVLVKASHDARLDEVADALTEFVARQSRPAARSETAPRHPLA